MGPPVRWTQMESPVTPANDGGDIRTEEGWGEGVDVARRAQAVGRPHPYPTCSRAPPCPCGTEGLADGWPEVR